MRTTTQERLETEPWWPTKTNLPLESFAGSASCSGCHVGESAARQSSMGRAALPASSDRFLVDRSPQHFSSGALSYTLSKASGGIEYTVANGARKLTQRLDWVIGAGDLGRTFLYQADGRWYQSELTFYTKPSALDITTGLDHDPSANLAAALGQPLSPEDARACFSCHTVHASTPAGLQPLHAEPGLGCEACHGPGRDHANTAGQKASTTSARVAGHSASIFNPAKLSPADSIDFCGSCHRTFADANLSLGGAASTAAVRFQPYRLEESKCWRSTQDERLTCVACHDPHEPLNRDAAAYDRKCQQCHTAVAKKQPEHAGAVCPKATSQCVSCHMPKVAIASMHGEFTDHFIRIVRDGEPFPK